MNTLGLGIVVMVVGMTIFIISIVFLYVRASIAKINAELNGRNIPVNEFIRVGRDLLLIWVVNRISLAVTLVGMVLTIYSLFVGH